MKFERKNIKKIGPTLFDRVLFSIRIDYFWIGVLNTPETIASGTHIRELSCPITFVCVYNKETVCW